MSPDRITSRTNPLIRELSRLQKRREREATGKYLIEGGREVERAVTSGVAIERVLIAPGLLSENHRLLADRLADTAGVVKVGASAFAALSRRQHPDGVLAVGRASSRRLEDLTLPPNPAILIAEQIEKPGNLGAILRSSDGAGVDVVIVADGVTDLMNPNVIRASQGSVFTTPTAVATTAETTTFLDARGVTIVALTPEATDDLWEIDLTGSIALAIGSEDAGLSPDLRRAGLTARIPMRGSADSLNASVAAAVALYEVVRQRR